MSARSWVSASALLLAIMIFARMATAGSADFAGSGVALGVAGGGSSTGPAVGSASVGYWRRLSSATLWRSNVEWLRIQAGTDDGPHIPEVTTIHEPSTMVGLNTGFDVHIPVDRGPVPFLGTMLGMGWASWGGQRIDDLNRGSYTVAGHSEPMMSLRIDLGFHLFTPPEWPSVRISGGLRVLASPHERAEAGLLDATVGLPLEP